MEINNGKEQFPHTVNNYYELLCFYILQDHLFDVTYVTLLTLSAILSIFNRYCTPHFLLSIFSFTLQTITMATRRVLPILLQKTRLSMARSTPMLSKRTALYTTSSLKRLAAVPEPTSTIFVIATNLHISTN